MNDPLISRPGTGGGDITIIAGGDLSVEGSNYIFTGTPPNQILKIKNQDTLLANRIDMIGADGSQTMTYADGT